MIIEPGLPNPTYKSLFVKNDGGTGADRCQSKLTLDITDEDIPEIRDVTALITPKEFRPLKAMNAHWELGTREVSINAHGGSELLNVVRVVKSHTHRVSNLSYDIPLHFEIPTDNGWDPIRVALKPKDYKGSIRIETMSPCKPAIRDFWIRYDGKADARIELS